MNAAKELLLFRPCAVVSIRKFESLQTTNIIVHIVHMLHITYFECIRIMSNHIRTVGVKLCKYQLIIFHESVLCFIDFYYTTLLNTIGWHGQLAVKKHGFKLQNKYVFFSFQEACFANNSPKTCKWGTLEIKIS